LRRLGVNKLCQTALLTASRSLRQAVLRGGIWGFAESRGAVTPDDVSANGDADGDVPPSPGELEFRDEAALVARLETTHIWRAQWRVEGTAQHLERGVSGSESEGADGDAASPRASVTRARDVFSSPGPQSPPWPTPVAEERAEEPSMAALPAQLDDADADGVGDGDAAGAFAAKTSRRHVGRGCVVVDTVVSVCSS
jgi:hypothetical protein